MNFDLNITKYVTVNFQAVVEAIDYLGGITLDIDETELKYLNGYVRELNRINNTNVPQLEAAGKQNVETVLRQPPMPESDIQGVEILNEPNGKELYFRRC